MHFGHLNRREFITLLAGAAVWPLAAHAQQSARPVVAFIQGGAANALAVYTAAFRQGLSEVGYTEGQNVTVEYHWLEGHYDRLPALVADLARRHVDLIATPGNVTGSLAAKAATATIPIVFGVGEDPVALGLVASLARPGGNVTGVNFFSLEANAKRLGLMHELLPKANRFAVLVNPSNASSIAAVTKGLTEAAPALGLEVVFFNATSADEIDAAFAALSRERCDALFIGGDGFFTSRRVQLSTLGARDRISCELCHARDGRSWLTYELWHQPERHIPPGRRLRRQHPEGRQARRPSGPAINQVRIRDQSADCPFPWLHYSADAARPRRRGHRVG